MASISSVSFQCAATNAQNRVCNGPNTFQATGSFSGNVGATSVTLRPSVGTITGILVTSQSVTSVQGQFQYSRSGGGGGSSFEDESGSISVTIEGAGGPPVQVTFPTISLP